MKNRSLHIRSKYLDLLKLFFLPTTIFSTAANLFQYAASDRTETVVSPPINWYEAFC